MLLHDMTMKEFKEGLKKTKTLFIPYGTVEAHGTHLPLSTDTIAIVKAAEAASEKTPIFLAPPIHYGVCTSTGHHPGSLGITPETLRRITLDLVRDGYSRGLRNFLLISGHGGSIHTSAMKEAGEILAGELKGANIAALTIYEIIMKEAYEIAETPGDSHAGELETSLIKYLEPALVKGKGRKERPKHPKPVIVADKIKYWPGAVNGDPTKASVEKGEKFFRVMVDAIVGLAGEIKKRR